jgi:DNA polymerase-3 subunit alpha
MSFKPKEDFVHLHVHTDLSQLDGCCRISDYVEEVSKRGNPAISFTDHGTMRGYMSQFRECEKYGIKPIYGIEFYVSNDMTRKGLSPEKKKEITENLSKLKAKEAIKKQEELEGIRKRWHLTVHAENLTGLKNLFKLSSMSYIDGFYYKPRIDIEALCRHQEGLIVSSGCVGSPINENWMSGNKRVAVECSDRLFDVFKDRFFLEIQPHDLSSQVVANILAAKLRRRYGSAVKLVATQDAHYLNQCDAIHHDALLCIGTRKLISDPIRMKFSGDEFHLRTRKEMIDAFNKHHKVLSEELIRESLNSTMLIGEMCDVEIKVDYHEALLPSIELPDKFDNDYEYLKDLCYRGWSWREIPNRVKVYSEKNGLSFDDALSIYKDRLNYELNSIKKQKFVPYFLLVHDLYNWVRSENIMAGPGRGSAAGCLISYLIGITSVDPIEHGLIFERFINKNRIDLPDIDMDFADNRRDEIFNYLEKKYGKDKFCKIATIGKLSGKNCLKDVSRVLSVPYFEANKLSGNIIERSSGDERAFNTIEDSFNEFDVCKEFNEKYPEVLFHSRKLEGLAKNLGIHAAGCIVSPVPLVDVIPLETRKHKDVHVIVSAGDLHDVAANGLVKLDVLGLRTLTVLREALDKIEERHGKKIDLESASVGLNDEKTLQNFTNRDFGGIFQFDTPSMYTLCSGVVFTSFNDIAAMNALNRPGTARSGLAAKYIDRKKNPEKALKDDFHPLISEITKDTLGIVVYQEHVIKIFTDVAGFDPSYSDILRKKISKSVGGEELDKERKKFVEGVWKHSKISEDVANKIMDAIVQFGSYGFNRSHAVAYAMISYWSMFIKTYYPIEFYWALIKNEQDILRIKQFISSAKCSDISFIQPDVNYSKIQFSIDEKRDAIRGSLIDIKGVGEKAAQSIVENQPFEDFLDFLERINRRRVHKGVVVALVKSCALDGLVPNSKWLVENIDHFWKIASKKTVESKKELKRMLEISKDKPDWSYEDKQIISSKINPITSERYLIDIYDSFIKNNVKLKIVDIDKDFYKKYNNKVVLISGDIAGIKVGQIGDYHKGAQLSEEEREKVFWGKRYANLNLDIRGFLCRIKFDFNIYPGVSSIIESEVGTSLIVAVSVNETFKSLRAHFAINLEDFRKKIESSNQLNIWEKILIGDHPIKSIPSKSNNAHHNRRLNRYFIKDKIGGVFFGVVTNVRLKYDKNGNQMAFFGLIGGDGFAIDVVCFASQWSLIKSFVVPEDLIAIEIKKSHEKKYGTSNCYDGGFIKSLKERNA